MLQASRLSGSAGQWGKAKGNGYGNTDDVDMLNLGLKCNQCNLICESSQRQQCGRGAYLGHRCGRVAYLD